MDRMVDRVKEVLFGKPGDWPPSEVATEEQQQEATVATGEQPVAVEGEDEIVTTTEEQLVGNEESIQEEADYSEECEGSWRIWIAFDEAAEALRSQGARAYMLGEDDAAAYLRTRALELQEQGKVEAEEWTRRHREQEKQDTQEVPDLLQGSGSSPE